MIVFVKVSPRRWLALDCPKYESGWRSTHRGRQPDAPAGTEEGILYATADIIAGPADWTTVEQAAIQHARDASPGKIVSAAQWDVIQKHRGEQLKALNQRIRDRGLGIGAVLAAPGNPDKIEARQLADRLTAARTGSDDDLRDAIDEAASMLYEWPE